MSLPHAALLALLGLGLVHTPIAAQDLQHARPEQRLELALELGLSNVKTGSLGKFQDKLIQLLQQELPQDSFDDEFSRFILDQGERCLPLRLQVFGSRKHDGMGERAFLVVLDTAAPLNLRGLTDSDNTEALEGTPKAWRNGTTAFRQLDLGGGQCRLLAGNVFGARPQQSPLFAGKQLPEPRQVKKGLLDRLRKAPYHLMLDVGVLSDDPAGTRQLKALVGRHGLLIGATMQEARGRPAVDLIWGVQPGQGLLGMFLPKKPGNARILGSLPFDPSFMLLGNLGREGRQGLMTACRAALAGGDRGNGAKEMLELLDCWDGEFQFLSRLPNPPAAPLAAIRPRGRNTYRDPVFSIVLKVEKDSEAEAIQSLKKLVPAMAGMSPRFMRFTQSKGVHTTDLGRGQLAIQGVDGLVVIVLGRTHDDCMEVLKGVREQYPVHTTPTKVVETKAPLKMFINQNNIARITHQAPRVPPHIAARGEKHAEAYLFGYRLTTELAKHLLTDDVLYSVSWNKACLRMRLQF